MRSGFVCIAGRPNVGKSTLLNSLIGEKVAITADKPQTTRNRIRGIYSGEGIQVVFIDTPGITRAKNKLGEYMAEAALGAFADVDLILFITCEKPGEKGGDRFILDRLAGTKIPKIAVINKIDTMSPDEFRDVYEAYEETGLFNEVAGISALTGHGVERLMENISAYIGEGPAFFPEGMITDRPERFLASEIIREKALRYLGDEVPHGVAIEIESFEEKPSLTRISAVIYIEKKSHKAIVIGKGGRKLKGIGKAAREEIEDLLGCKVYLSLWVKVREKWRDSDLALASLGYGGRD
ncbi:MAG: GTPase Era [Clostridiales Family XIII bacterium]|jgi:GTP-binding protein Era|nr:GTPase Era [Clostridiales Family XIII bacterium]